MRSSKRQSKNRQSVTVIAALSARSIPTNPSSMMIAQDRVFTVKTQTALKPHGFGMTQIHSLSGYTIARFIAEARNGKGYKSQLQAA